MRSKNQTRNQKTEYRLSLIKPSRKKPTKRWHRIVIPQSGPKEGHSMVDQRRINPNLGGHLGAGKILQGPASRMYVDLGEQSRGKGLSQMLRRRFRREKIRRKAKEARQKREAAK